MILCSCTQVSEKTYKEWCHLMSAPDEVLFAGKICGHCKERCEEIKEEKFKEIQKDII
jgi:hypothetical protein